MLEINCLLLGFGDVFTLRFAEEDALPRLRQAIARRALHYPVTDDPERTGLDLALFAARANGEWLDEAAPLATRARTGEVPVELRGTYLAPDRELRGFWPLAFMFQRWDVGDRLVWEIPVDAVHILVEFRHVVTANANANATGSAIGNDERAAPRVLGRHNGDTLIRLRRATYLNQRLGVYTAAGLTVAGFVTSTIRRPRQALLEAQFRALVPDFVEAIGHARDDPMRAALSSGPLWEFLRILWSTLPAPRPTWEQPATRRGQTLIKRAAAFDLLLTSPHGGALMLLLRGPHDHRGGHCERFISEALVGLEVLHDAIGTTAAEEEHDGQDGPQGRPTKTIAGVVTDLVRWSFLVRGDPVSQRDDAVLRMRRPRTDAADDTEVVDLETLRVALEKLAGLVVEVFGGGQQT